MVTRKHQRYKKFPLLYQDNINYGYSRNMLGMKWLTVIISVFYCIKFCLLYFLNYDFIEEITINVIISILINSFIIIIWIFFVNGSTAEAYATLFISSYLKVNINFRL